MGHDRGGFAGYLMVLRSPERFDGYLALNMAHPWVTARILLPHFAPFLKGRIKTGAGDRPRLLGSVP
jgi:pimeloyl-ACP methyl ester carboxylesterase